MNTKSIRVFLAAFVGVSIAVSAIADGPCWQTQNVNSCVESDNCENGLGETCGECLTCVHSGSGVMMTAAMPVEDGKANRKFSGAWVYCTVTIRVCVYTGVGACPWTCEDAAYQPDPCPRQNSSATGEACSST